ncbi:MAG: class I SAM-dependent methyltransferase [Chlorobium sp.]|nr:MAG: class I SAM-dependent methyltransferase [Chlorobium sp.]
MQPKEHWEKVYATKPADAVSWYQEHADLSLRLVREAGLPLGASIIDVGGGASTLVDDLLREGYSSLTVLDLSASALSQAKVRLGERAENVTWIEANITDITLPAHAYDLWHDRAVFHFLTTEQERKAYLSLLLRAVKPEGQLIIATFAEDGPLQCSGLPVRRYSLSELQAELGKAFTLVKHEREEHHTPAGAAQKFIYCHFKRSVPSMVQE